jgi:hypothetical protein
MDLKDPSVSVRIYRRILRSSEQAALPTEANRYCPGLIFDPGINRGDSERCSSFVSLDCFGRSLGKGLHLLVCAEEFSHRDFVCPYLDLEYFLVLASCEVQDQCWKVITKPKF